MPPEPVPLGQDPGTDPAGELAGGITVYPLQPGNTEISQEVESVAGEKDSWVNGNNFLVGFAVESYSVMLKKTRVFYYCYKFV